MAFQQPDTLKKYPFVRLLIPLVAGIVLQWYLQFSIFPIIVLAITNLVLLLLYYFLSFKKKYALHWLQGGCIMLMFALLGAVVPARRAL